MWELGRFALRLGLCLTIYAIAVDLLGHRRKKKELLRSGRNATIGSLLCLTVATLSLWVLLFQGEFAVAYVAAHSSKALPGIYKLTALWAGAAGSLLLWLWFQTGFVVWAFSGSKNDGFCATARAAANLVAVFFFLVLLFDKDPFALSVVTPDDGAGLNPLLQHPAMALHPPALFLGYAGLAVPYAWALAALRRARSAGQPPLLNRAREWSLFAWMLLTVGIALGAWWAYEELGWGGYWAWDPVENSSLIPWLTATALLHCGRTFRTSPKIASWFMVLAIVTFSLCIFGTFLTRYGLVSSVHAFPEPGLGILFLVLLVHIWIIAVVLFVRRHIRAVTQEAHWNHGVRFILLNNWLMVVLAFVILTGTLFPFFSGLVSDRKISLKPDYFTKITAPGGLLLLLLGICPHLLRRGFNKNWRTLTAGAVSIAAVAIWVFANSLAVAYLIACSFVAVNLVADWFERRPRGQTRGASGSARRPAPALRWYGTRVVHLGVVLTFVGIAGSGGFGLEEQVALRAGENVQIGAFDLTYNDLNARDGSNYTAVTADLSVAKGQKRIGELAPALAFYSESGKRTSEVDIRRTLAGDFYVALTEADTATKLINLTVYTKPLINWIWIGSALMVVGTAFVLAGVLGQRPNGRQQELVENQ